MWQPTQEGDSEFGRSPEFGTRGPASSWPHLKMSLSALSTTSAGWWWQSWEVQQEGRKWPDVMNKSPASSSAWQIRWQGADVPRLSRTPISTPDTLGLRNLPCSRNLPEPGQPRKSCCVWLHAAGQPLALKALGRLHVSNDISALKSWGTGTCRKERTKFSSKSCRQCGAWN